jgi:hypothetical protein
MTTFRSEDTTMQHEIQTALTHLGPATLGEIASYLGITDKNGKWRLGDAMKRMRKNFLVEMDDTDRPPRYILTNPVVEPVAENNTPAAQQDEDGEDGADVVPLHAPAEENAAECEQAPVSNCESSVETKLATLEKLACITSSDISAVLMSIMDDLRSGSPGSLDNLAQRVVEWAVDRDIIAHSTAQAQYLKAAEEMGELAADIARGRDVRDSIGDVIVCLINLAAISGVSMQDCLQTAWDDIKDRKGHMTADGVFVKEEDAA